MGIVHLYQQGGPVILFILGCSILAFAVFLERLFYLRGKYHFPQETTVRLQDLNENNMSSLTDHLRTTKRPLHDLILKLFEVKHLPPTEVQERLSLHLQHTQKGFEKYTDVLATVASITPLLGLLGTVTGMMHVFETINNQGLGNPNLLAGGISEALITTIAGLLVAIPSFIAYKIVTARANVLTERIEKQLNTVYEKLNKQSTTST